MDMEDIVFSSSLALSGEESEDLSEFSTVSSWDTIEDQEDRTGYLSRQGLAAVIRYEDRENRGSPYQENSDFSAQNLELNRQTRHHMRIMREYFQEPIFEPYLKSSTERSKSTQQVEKSLNWIETVELELGQLFRQEFFHKERFNLKKLEEEGEETNLIFSNLNQQRDLLNPSSQIGGLNYALCCKGNLYLGKVKLSFGPKIALQSGLSFGRKDVGIGFTYAFNENIKKRESSVGLSLSASKGIFESSVATNFSKQGTEYTLVAYVNKPFDAFSLNAKLQV